MGSVLSSTDSLKSQPDSPISTDSRKPNSTDSRKPNSTSTSQSSPAMTSSSDPKTHTLELANSQTEAKTTKESDQETKPIKQNQQTDQQEAEGDGEDVDEEEGECGFCLFMKGGGCKDVFIDWENCIKEAELKKEDVVSKCFDATSALRKCMQAHADYYEPILKVEKDAEEAAMKELQKEKISETELESEFVGDETEKKADLDSSDSTIGK